MSFITIDSQAVEQIKAYLQANGVKGPIRIDLQSTGCCDPSLGLSVDREGAEDMKCEHSGVKFLIGPSVHQTVGDVKIEYSNDSVSPGFILTSAKPLSEWEGFGVCNIKIGENP